MRDPSNPWFNIPIVLGTVSCVCFSTTVVFIGWQRLPIRATLAGFGLHLIVEINLPEPENNSFPQIEKRPLPGNQSEIFLASL